MPKRNKDVRHSTLNHLTENYKWRHVRDDVIVYVIDFIITSACVFETFRVRNIIVSPAKHSGT